MEKNRKNQIGILVSSITIIVSVVASADWLMPLIFKYSPPNITLFLVERFPLLALLLITAPYVGTMELKSRPLWEYFIIPFIISVGSLFSVFILASIIHPSSPTSTEVSMPFELILVISILIFIGMRMKGRGPVSRTRKLIVKLPGLCAIITIEIVCYAMFHLLNIVAPAKIEEAYLSSYFFSILAMMIIAGKAKDLQSTNSVLLSSSFALIITISLTFMVAFIPHQ